MFTWGRTYQDAIFSCTYIHAYIHAYIRIYVLHTYMNTYTRMYVRTYIHTYIHMYIHTYIHTYIHSMYIYVYTYVYAVVATTLGSRDRYQRVATHGGTRSPSPLCLSHVPDLLIPSPSPTLRTCDLNFSQFCFLFPSNISALNPYSAEAVQSWSREGPATLAPTRPWPCRKLVMMSWCECSKNNFSILKINKTSLYWLDIGNVPEHWLTHAKICNSCENVCMRIYIHLCQSIYMRKCMCENKLH